MFWIFSALALLQRVTIASLYLEIHELASGLILRLAHNKSRSIISVFNKDPEFGEVTGGESSMMSSLLHFASLNNEQVCANKGFLGGNRLRSCRRSQVLDQTFEAAELIQELCVFLLIAEVSQHFEETLLHEYLNVAEGLGPISFYGFFSWQFVEECYKSLGVEEMRLCRQSFL